MLKLHKYIIIYVIILVSYIYSIYICNVIIKQKKMTTYRKAITLEEANILLNSRTGTAFPNTSHNRQVMKQAVDNLLLRLRNEK